jgi:hypothetical protein
MIFYPWFYIDVCGYDMNLLENAANAVEILLYSGSNCDFGLQF